MPITVPPHCLAVGLDVAEQLHRALFVRDWLGLPVAHEWPRLAQTVRATWISDRDLMEELPRPGESPLGDVVASSEEEWRAWWGGETDVQRQVFDVLMQAPDLGRLITDLQRHERVPAARLVLSVVVVLADHHIHEVPSDDRRIVSSATALDELFVSLVEERLRVLIDQDR